VFVYIVLEQVSRVPSPLDSHDIGYFVGVRVADFREIRSRHPAGFANMSFAPPEAHQQFQVGHPSSHHNQKHAYLGKVVLGLETLRGYCGCGTPWEMGIGTNADNNPPSRLSHHFLPVLLSPLSPRLQHILRLLNTNVKGGGKIMFALTEIKGVGRRYANLVCKKADVDLNKR